MVKYIKTLRMVLYMRPTHEEIDKWIAKKGRWLAFTLVQCGIRCV